MTGPEHYREAEALAESASEWMGGWGELEMPAAERLARKNSDLAKAQVHATLALAAATALGHLKDGAPMDADRAAWTAAASEHPGQLRRIREAAAADLAEYAKEAQT